MGVKQQIERYRHDPPQVSLDVGNVVKGTAALILLVLATWYASKASAYFNWNKDFEIRSAAMLREEKKKWQEAERQEVAQQDRDRAAAAADQAREAAANARSAAEIARRLASIRQTCVADSATAAAVSEIYKEANK